MQRIGYIVLAALLVWSAGCHRDGATLGISDSTFVTTIARLHAINADTLLDSTARATKRALVLREQGVTADSLERAARAMSADPQHALAVWSAIQERVRAPHRNPSSR